MIDNGLLITFLIYITLLVIGCIAIIKLHNFFSNL